MRRITAMPPKTMLKTLMAGTMLVGAMLVGTGMTPAVAGDDIALAMTPIPPDNSLYPPCNNVGQNRRGMNIVAT
jgi:hypothetical protein